MAKQKPTSIAHAKALATIRREPVYYKGVTYCPTCFAWGSRNWPNLSNVRCGGKNTKSVQPQG